MDQSVPHVMNRYIHKPYPSDDIPFRGSAKFPKKIEVHLYQPCPIPLLLIYAGLGPNGIRIREIPLVYRTTIFIYVVKSAANPTDDDAKMLLNPVG